jgi:hypothetical protein
MAWLSRLPVPRPYSTPSTGINCKAQAGDSGEVERTVADRVPSKGVLGSITGPMILEIAASAFKHVVE